MLRFLMTSCMAAVLAAGATAQATSQFRITEVLVNPTSGDQIVEIKNLGPSGATIGNHNLCLQLQYVTLPFQFMNAGKSIRVHIGVAGTNTPDDIFTGAAFPTMNAVADSMGLYRPGGGMPFFGNPANMIDFVQWGAANQLRSDVAVAANLWDDTTKFIPTPVADESIAWDGDGDDAADWFRDVGPTLGAENLTATASVVDVGPGCGETTPPVLTAGAPALGNKDFFVDIDSTQTGSQALLFINAGTTNIPVLLICNLYVPQPALELSGLPLDVDGDIRLSGLIPEDATLAGIPLGFQALVVNGVAIPKFDLSNGLEITF